jgi:hypothetical protein
MGLKMEYMTIKQAAAEQKIAAKNGGTLRVVAITAAQLCYPRSFVIENTYKQTTNHLSIQGDEMSMMTKMQAAGIEFGI